MPSDDESVGRSTYESLVRLTFLCGRGLEPAELLRRFLVAMRDCVPATGLWVFQGGRIIASDAARGVRAPKAPSSVMPGLAPQVNDVNEVVAPVLPEMILVCRLGNGSVQRAADVVSLMARVIALAWQAEMLAHDEAWDDDYLAAKAMFKRRWIRSVVRRHGGNISAAARAGGLSRGTFYNMMDQVGVQFAEGTVNDEAEPPKPAPDTVSLKAAPRSKR
ncbi:MAG: hypothetical protein J0M02_11640 [Planctomycetes bacterium]|nr:hypothetical protein [Planctomycetota bacterium]